MGNDFHRESHWNSVSESGSGKLSLKSVTIFGPTPCFLFAQDFIFCGAQLLTCSKGMIETGVPEAYNIVFTERLNIKAVRNQAWGYGAPSTLLSTTKAKG